MLTGEFAAMLRDAGFEQVSSDMFATVYRDKAGKVALTVFTDSGLMEFKKNKDDGPGTGGGQVFEKDENGYFLPLLCFNVDDPMTAINAYEESAGHKVSEWMDNMFTVDKAEPKRPLVDIVYVLTDDKSMLREVIVGCSADNFSKGDFEQFLASKGFEAIGGADGIFVEQRYYNKELKLYCSPISQRNYMRILTLEIKKVYFILNIAHLYILRSTVLMILFLIRLGWK